MNTELQGHVTLGKSSNPAWIPIYVQRVWATRASQNKRAEGNHCTEAVLPAQDPSWLQQKSESINSITWTLYAWCCSTAFPEVYQPTCITRIFSFSAVTQFSVIFSNVKQNYINLALKWLSLLREYLKCIDNTHFNSQALCLSVFFVFQF